MSSYKADSGVGLSVSSKAGSGDKPGEIPDTKAQPETLGYTLMITSQDESGMTHLDTCSWSPGTKLRLTDGGQRYSFGTADVTDNDKDSQIPTSFTYDPNCKPGCVPISFELTDGTVRKHPILLPIPPPGTESIFTLKKDGSVFRDGKGGYIGRLRPIYPGYSYDSTGKWNSWAWPGRL